MLLRVAGVEGGDDGDVERAVEQPHQRAAEFDRRVESVGRFDPRPGLKLTVRLVARERELQLAAHEGRAVGVPYAHVCGRVVW